MAASQYDFKIEQGSSFRMSLIYNSNGTAIDLANYCARLVWKTNTNVTQTLMKIRLSTNYSLRHRHYGK